MQKMLNLEINRYYEIYTSSQQSPDHVIRIVEVKGKTVCSSKNHKYFVTWPSQKKFQNPCCHYMWDVGVANMSLSRHYDLYVSVIRGCREVTRADFVRQHRELSPEEIESFRRELIYDIERRKCIGCISSSFCHRQPSYKGINDKDIKYCPCINCIVKMVCVTACVEYRAHLEYYHNHLMELTNDAIQKQK